MSRIDRRHTLAPSGLPELAAINGLPRTPWNRHPCGGTEVAAGPFEDADLIFTGAPPILAAGIYGKQPVRELEAQGALRIEADRGLAERFVSLFPLPPQGQAGSNDPAICDEFSVADRSAEGHCEPLKRLF